MLNRKSWIDRSRRCSDCYGQRARGLETFRARGYECGCGPSARARRVRASGRREAARAQPDDDGDRHRARAALDHAAQRAAGHGAPGGARAGQIVEAGTVLVALDVSVEEAELQAQEAQAELAETQFARMQTHERAARRVGRWKSTARAPSATWRWRRSRARKAIIARKTIRAPFRARVGISDVHPGPVPERRHAADHAAGRRRRRARRFHGRAAGRRGAARRRQASMCSRPATRRADHGRRFSRSMRASIRPRATRRCARDDRTSADACAVAGRVGARAGAGRRAASCASPFPPARCARARRRSRVRPRARRGGQDPRAACAPVQVERMLGRRSRDRARASSRGEQVAASGSFKLREAALVAVTNLRGSRAERSVTARCNAGARSAHVDRWCSERRHAMRSFTDIFIKHPVLAIVVNLVIVLVGWRALSTLPVQQYPEHRELVGHHHDGLHRRQRRDRARLPDHADRARGVRDQRRRLRRVDQPRRRQHGHRAPEAESQQHRGAGRSHRAAAAGALRAAGRGRAAGRRSAARRPAVRDVLSQLHLDASAACRQITDWLSRTLQPQLVDARGRAARQLSKAAGSSRCACGSIPIGSPRCNLSPGDVHAALQRNNYLAAVGQTKGNLVQVNLLANTDLRVGRGVREPDRRRARRRDRAPERRRARRARRRRSRDWSRKYNEPAGRLPRRLAAAGLERDRSGAAPARRDGAHPPDAARRTSRCGWCGTARCSCADALEGDHQDAGRDGADRRARRVPVHGLDPHGARAAGRDAGLADRRGDRDVSRSASASTC